MRSSPLPQSPAITSLAIISLDFFLGASVAALPFASSFTLAGTAAALCDDFTRLDISKLQAVLKSNGVVLHEDDLK